MPVNHESPVREGLIIKRSAELSALAIDYAQKIACELVCQTQGLEKLSAEEVELIENSDLVPVVMAGLAKIGSYEKDVEKGRESAHKERTSAKEHLGRKALKGLAIGAPLGALYGGAFGAGSGSGEGGKRTLKELLAHTGGGAAVGGGYGALLNAMIGRGQRQHIGYTKEVAKLNKKDKD